MKRLKSWVASALLWLSSYLGACGGTPLENTTRAYGVARVAHDRAVPTVAEVVEAKMRECSDEPCVDALAEQWRRPQAAINAASGTLNEGATALERWATEDPDGKGPPGACEAARDAINAVQHYVAMLAEFDVSIPVIGSLEVDCE